MKFTGRQTVVILFAAAIVGTLLAIMMDRSHNPARDEWTFSTTVSIIALTATFSLGVTRLTVRRERNAS